MTETQPAVGEADLHAFVDGRLDETRRAVVARYLAENPEQGQRVRDWIDQAESLRRELRRGDAAERDAIMARLAGAGLRRSAASRAVQRSVMAASLVLALGFGALGGWIARGDHPLTEITRLGIEAATAYHVFANDADRPVEISSDNRAELVAWMNQKLGRRVTVPDLGPMGYHLMGGRVLTALYGPAAMLLYRDAGGNRITVYLQPMRIGLPEPMRLIQARAVDGYAWIDRHIGYSVISDGDPAALRQVADRVRADTRP